MHAYFKAGRALPALTAFGLLAGALAPIMGQVAVNYTGTVTDSAGTPISGAAVKLVNMNISTTTGADGKFTLGGATGIADDGGVVPFASVRDGSIFLSIDSRTEVAITAFGLRGEALGAVQRTLNAGSHSLQLPGLVTGVSFLKVAAGGRESLIKTFAIAGALRGSSVGFVASKAPLAKGAAAAPYYDVITATKAGYLVYYQSVANSDSANMQFKLTKEGGAKFSFFVTSLKALQDFSKNEQGFGGDFSFGETGAGAGLRGADKLCATIAERSMPGSKNRGWRAFLSVSSDAYGKQVNAIDRIGNGPWYDRLGRQLAPTKADLIGVRPANGDATIRVNLPNEDGVLNKRPDPTKPEVDNHHMATGSDAEGKLKGATGTNKMKYTCRDWTSKTYTQGETPTCGFAWPRQLNNLTSGANWMTTFDAPGCAPGVDINGTGGPPPGSTTIGAGGGYGGYYCFALNP